MQRIRMFGLAAISSFSLILGCGGGETSVNGAADPPGSVQVHVQGTSSPVVGGTQPIDPSQNGGHFTVSWSVTPNPGAPAYTASLRVSKSSNGSGPGFFEIGRSGCNSGSGDFCTDSASYTCTFDSANRISCNGGATTDLTNFFSSLPENDYIVFSFRTNGSSSPPNEASVPVQFR